MGISLARSLDSTMGYDEDEVLRGFKDGIYKEEGLPSNEDLQKFYLDEQQRRYQKQNSAVLENERAAQKFLNDISIKEQLTSAGTGVFYKIIKPGEGAPVAASDKLVVKYKGLLPDGSVFEDKTSKAVTLKFTEVVPGWRVLAELFKKGSVTKVYLSPQQAYGIQGQEKVPPMSAVIFEIEIVDIIRQPQRKIRL